MIPKDIFSSLHLRFFFHFSIHKRDRKERKCNFDVFFLSSSFLIITFVDDVLSGQFISFFHTILGNCFDGDDTFSFFLVIVLHPSHRESLKLNDFVINTLVLCLKMEINKQLRLLYSFRGEQKDELGFETLNYYKIQKFFRSLNF